MDFNIEPSTIKHLDQHGLVLCTSCKYTIWPTHFVSHFRNLHKMSMTLVKRLQHEMLGFGNLADPHNFQMPLTVDVIIPGLPIYQGFKCSHSSECHYACATQKGIQDHSRQQHNYNRHQHRGQPSKAKKAKLAVDNADNHPWRPIVCQRFKTSGVGSSYFEVLNPSPVEPVTSNLAWQQKMQELQAVTLAVKAQEKQIIDEGTKNEVNPWLERTQWLLYLQGFDRQRLLASTAEPDKAIEPTASLLWNAMDQLVNIGEKVVSTQAGVFIRLEAVRTQLQQANYVPLKPYQDSHGQYQAVRPWKEILMFIYRTQTPHEWSSPRYHLTSDQQSAWDSLIQAAILEIHQQPQPIDSQNEDDSNNIPKYIPLPSFQRQLLFFCCMLLDQRIQSSEYDAVFVDGLAVLGVTESSWKGPDTYTKILSAAIKVSRYFVILTALEHSLGNCYPLNPTAS